LSLVLDVLNHANLQCGQWSKSLEREPSCQDSRLPQGSL
jgi:hypothetical protein